MKMIRISALWCSSCIVTYPIWKELQEKYPDISFEEYDYDMDSDQIASFQVGQVLPVILVFHQGKEIKRIIGEKKKQEIFEEIEKMMEKL